MGARGDFGFALYVASGSDSLADVTSPKYVAAPGCVVRGATVIGDLWEMPGGHHQCTVGGENKLPLEGRD